MQEVTPEEKGFFRRVLNKIKTFASWVKAKCAFKIHPKVLLGMKVTMYISLPLFPLFCMFIMEYMNFGNLYQLTNWRERSPLAMWFGVFIVMGIFMLLLLLCRKAAIAAGIMGATSLLFAYINYVKVAANGDNFFPRDLAMAGNTGDLMTFASLNISGYFWFGLVGIILWATVFGLLNIEIPIKWRVRLPVCFFAALLAYFPFATPDRIETLLYRFEMNIFDTAVQGSNYDTNGFVSAFAINVLSMNVQRPPGYSRQAILDLLEGFEFTETTGELFDVIVVLSESFFDIRILPGIYFSENPIPNFDAVRARPNAYSGLVYTTALTGGTIRPEFDILTGLTTDFLPNGSIPYTLMTRPMQSYVSNYRDAGYRTIALHTFDERFYTRHIAFPLLGFDTFYGEQTLTQMFEMERNNTNGFIKDMSMFYAMDYFLEDTSQPTFMFAITMQNHQPFHATPHDDIAIHVTSDLLSQHTLDMVTTYTQGLADADRMLGRLVDFVDNRERPTILLFFGDHLPNLGGNLAAHTQTGLLDPNMLWTPEARLIMYSTPFVIYSNRPLQPILCGETDNHVSTYYLLSIIAYQTRFQRTPYMNLLLDYFQRVPFHNIRLHMHENDDMRSLANAKRLITYDRLVGGNYSR